MPSLIEIGLRLVVLEKKMKMLKVYGSDYNVDNGHCTHFDQ